MGVIDMKKHKFNVLRLFLLTVLSILILNILLQSSNSSLVYGAVVRSGKYIRLNLDDKYCNGIDKADLTKWIDYLDSAFLKYYDLVGRRPVNGIDIVSQDSKGAISIASNTITFGKDFQPESFKKMVIEDYSSKIVESMGYIFNFDGRWNYDNTSFYVQCIYAVEQTLGQSSYDKLCLDKKTNASSGYDNTFMKDKFSSDGLTYIMLNIKEKIGWEPFKKTYGYFNSLVLSSIPKTKLDKLNLFMTKLNEYSDFDVLSLISQHDKDIITTALGGSEQDSLKYISTSNFEIADKLDTKDPVYRKISSDEAYKMMVKNNKKFKIVDVRSKEAYLQNTIKGAISIPLQELNERAQKELKNKDQLIFVNCGGGGISITGAKQLIDMGYTNVFDIGGVRAWKYATTGK